ncbi:MAG: DNA cytosine methyltransferase [archaeon]|nr:DNA cytosine methyltransferase [archaeon]
MKILIACEYSGTVREAFTTKGHNVISCDFLPTDISGKHYQGNVFDIINDDFDMMIAFPPCTYLCSSGLHWNKRKPERVEKTELALLFVRQLLEADIPKIALENPIGCISTKIRKPNQIIQPYHFGHPESKSTCLWLKNLPLLKHTDVLIKPEKGHWNNQTKSGQNKLAPSKDRWKIRSKTYQGIADAMANQWG